MPDYFLKKKSLLDRFKDNHGRTGYIQSARAEHTWSNPIKRNRRTKELNGWIKSFAGKKHIRKLARFNTLNNGKNENLEEAMNWINVTDNTKEILKNGSEKSSLNTIEDVVADLAYAQAASDTIFGRPTTAKSILWKAAENFKDSELNFDDNGSFIEDFIVNYEDQFREIYPYAVQNCDWLKLDPDFDKTYNSDDKFPFVEWVISQVAKELFKYAPADADAKESKDVDEKPTEAIQINTPIVLYKGDAENAAKAHNYLYKKLPRVKGASIASDVKPLGNNKFCRVLFYGSNTGVMKLFGYYSDMYDEEFWNNCEADPDGWVNPQTIDRYDGATPRQESKKHEGFNTTRDLDNFAQHILNYIKDKTHYPGYVRFVKLNDDEEDFYGKYFLAVNGKNYYLYVGDTDYTITDNNDENTLVEGSTDLSGAMNKDLDDFCKRIQQPFYTESKEPTDEKLSYEKGHKNSRGENAPWVIRSHEDNRVLASFAKKKDAEEHLKRMKQYSKNESKQNEGLSNEKVKDAVKFAATEAGLENYLDVDSDGAMSVTVTLSLDSNELHEVRWVIDSNEGTIEEYLDTEKNHVKNFTDDESLVSMLTLLFQTTRMTLRNELPKKYKQSETKENGERCVDDYDTLTDGLSELGFVPSSNIRNGMIYPYRSRFTATKDGVKYHFWIHEDPSGGYTDYIEVWGGKFTTNGDPEDPETTKFNTVSDVLEELKSVKKYEAHDLDTYKSDVLSDLVVNLFHGEDGAKKLVDEYANAIEDAFNRGDTSMEIATEIDTMAGKHESKDVSLKEIARTLDTAINKDGNYSVKDNTSGVTATDKDRTQTIRVSKDLKVELEDKDGKHSYEAQSLRDLSKYIRRAVKGEYVNEDFHKTQVKDAVYDVINRHNLNNAVKVSYLGNSVVCKYADRTLRIQPDLLTTMSTKDGDNVDTYPTNLKELDGYLDRVFGHYADELAESKQSEGLKLDYVNTITVPQWLWEAYLLGNEYGGDLTDDEQTILYDFKEKYKDCHLDDRGEEPDFHSRNDFDCYGGNCYIVDVYTKTDVKEKKSEKLFNKQELEAHARGADILDQLQYRFSFSFYSPKTYTDAVDTALAMNAESDKRIAHETIGDSEFRLYTDDPYNAIRFRDRLSNRAGIPAEDLASTFRSAVGIRKNGGYATEDEQETIGRYAAENYVSFSVSEDNSTMYVEGELPNVVEFFEAISSAEPA